MDDRITRISPAAPEVGELLLQIAALVRCCDVLRERGATSRELEPHEIELERLRRALARAAQKSFAGDPQAA